MGQIQIPEALFNDLLRYHLAGRQDEATAERIRSALITKQESRARRAAYTKSLQGNEDAKAIVDALKPRP